MAIIKIELDMEQTARFIALKKDLGLFADTEVIRYALNALYKKLNIEAPAAEAQP